MSAKRHLHLLLVASLIVILFALIPAKAEEANCHPHGTRCCLRYSYWRDQVHVPCACFFSHSRILFLLAQSWSVGTKDGGRLGHHVSSFSPSTWRESQGRRRRQRCSCQSVCLRCRADSVWPSRRNLIEAGGQRSRISWCGDEQFPQLQHDTAQRAFCR